MQLVLDHSDESESVPILQPDNESEIESENDIYSSGGDESRISIRIGNISSGGESVSTRESQGREIEERESEESLVQDQPQCRICLETGGNLFSGIIYLFSLRLWVELSS